MTKLSRAVIACISATMMLLGVAPIAGADTVPLIDDPLHGHCLAGCTSNGTNTPIGSNPSQGFYFQASPASSGTYFIDVLVPNNMLIAGPLHITGDLTVVLNLFQRHGLDVRRTWQLSRIHQSEPEHADRSLSACDPSA